MQCLPQQIHRQGEVLGGGASPVLKAVLRSRMALPHSFGGHIGHPSSKPRAAAGAERRTDLRRSRNTLDQVSCPVTAAAVTASTSAFAVTSPVTATVKIVEYSDPSSWPLLIQLNTSPATNYMATVGPPGCSIPAPGLDTLKAWLSLSQAALLSGRT